MENLSREVTSNQQSIHKNLDHVVRKHLETDLLRPFAKHNISAFESFIQHYKNQPLIFDSGCGTGRSTLMLAQKHPEAFVVGIDKSETRLTKLLGALNDEMLEKQNNLCIVRADHDDFLRIAARENLKLWKHKLYYPNPWPKSQHLKRRWHGSPLFKTLLALGGEIELRSNWKLYIDEFAVAIEISAHCASVQPLALNSHQYVSDFEEKYHKSHQKLWQLRCQL